MITIIAGVLVAIIAVVITVIVCIKCRKRKGNIENYITPKI